MKPSKSRQILPKRPKLAHPECRLKPDQSIPASTAQLTHLVDRHLEQFTYISQACLERGHEAS